MDDADAPRVGVVLVAAGSGSRLGAGRPKAFVEIAGDTLLAHAVMGVHAADVAAIAVVVPPSHLEQAREIVEPLLGCPCAESIIVPGGAERSDSVRAGLGALAEADCDIILVHDAARCLTPVGVFERVIAAVRGGAAGAVPGLPVVDTIKEVDAEGLITGTPDRARLRAVQTPQGFAAPVLHAAYAALGDATDDAALVEALGHRVRVVDGDPLAFKVTTAQDVRRAQQILLAGSGA